jgi:uncharacterized repeat protein (TIGR03803 family)
MWQAQVDAGRSPPAIFDFLSGAGAGGIFVYLNESFTYNGPTVNGNGAWSITPAQIFTTLHSFDGTDGENPVAALVQGTDGNFYGTTKSGGANIYYGTIFKINPTPPYTLTPLYSFCSAGGASCTDGYYPVAGLVQDTNGDFYGTTYEGGANCAPYGCGTTFKIGPSGGSTFTPLYSFCTQGGCADGAEPIGGLIQANNGELYGTTQNGGTYNSGAVFKIGASGGSTFKLVYSFCSQMVSGNCTDGEYPRAGLVQATNGDLYGATYYGGANGLGTIFKITPSGALTTVYNFDGAHGAYPSAGLVQATNGEFYGTTSGGGTSNQCEGGCGTVFKIKTTSTPPYTLTRLYSFCHQPGCPDGASPASGLIQATNGYFYGTTYAGGANNSGTIFKIGASGGGTFQTLYTFCAAGNGNCTDGANPAAALVQGTSGDFYGTTEYGGDSDTCSSCGTVFRLSVGLGPFVETRPTSGKVGAAVKILGTDLTGATSVSFNGTAAGFKVVSSSEITTAVPGGATTGEVQVVTPNRTLSSNIAFRVP